MRIGVVWEDQTSAAFYRAYYPLQALERRGHEIVWPTAKSGELEARRLTTCDVVHVYRRYDPDTIRVATELARAGIAITWDNDDDFLNIPEEHPQYRQIKGKLREFFALTIEMASLAHAVTTTTEALADVYRQAGVEEIEVIPNLLPADSVRSPRRHDGIVIGWVAGMEHRADADRLGIAETMQRVLADHPDVRVECIGLDLGLRERYRHDAYIEFEQLADRIAGFDIGLAPLADIPFNRSRSDIKLKEYAARGVAWLASPVGPYLGLGEEHGGRLVADDGWYDALSRLVARGRERRRLARRGRSWAKRQTVDAAANRWERHFVRAADAARAQAGSGERSMGARR
jgi:hypothetical protein